MFFKLDFGVYHRCGFYTNVRCVMMNADWCIMRHSSPSGGETLRLAFISHFGMIFSHTGAKFPRSALCLVSQQTEHGHRVSADLGDFLFLTCECPDMNVAAHTVADRVQTLLPGWKPFITRNSLYGASLTHFEGFRIKGSGVALAPDWNTATRLPVPQHDGLGYTALDYA